MIRYSLEKCRAKKNNKIICCIMCSLLVGNMIFFNDYEGVLRSITLCILSFVVLNVFVNFTDNKGLIKNSNIYIIYLIRFIVLCLIFQIGWKYTLDTGNAIYGYDPARYYYQAIELIENGFRFRTGIINYAGIIYWYAVLFLIFGKNPIVVLIVNNLFTIVSFMLIYAIYESFTKKKSINIMKFIMGGTFIPELLWYDCLSSRETLCMALIVISIYCLYSMFVDNKLSIANVGVFFVSVVMLGLVRLSLLVLIFLSIAIFILFSKRKKIIKICMIFICVICLSGVSVISGQMGSNNTELSTLLMHATKSNTEGLEGLNWSQNSIGQMLIIDSPVKLFILSPIRMFVYLISPLPAIGFSFDGLMMRDYSSWQGIFVFISALGYFFCISKIITSIFSCFKKKGESFLVMMLFMVTLFVVANGTQIIHDRYRIIAVPWIFLMIKTSNVANKREKEYGKLFFAVLLFIAIVSFGLIKIF